MLVDVVGFNERIGERLVRVVSQQVFTQRDDDLLGVATGRERFERGGAGGAPGGEVRVHAGDEGSELRVVVDGGLDGRLLNREIDVPGAVGPEETLPKLRAHLPVPLQRIHIGNRDAALEVPLDVL